MEEESRRKLKLGIGAAAVVLTIGTLAGFALKDGNSVTFGQPVYAQTNTVINCGKYLTNTATNLSHEKILTTVPSSKNYENFDNSIAASLSDIVTSVVATNSQFYRQEDGKTGYSSWKIGSSSTGSITFTLDPAINAIGFYAVAYAHEKDTGKFLKVNGTKINQPLIAATSFDINDNNQRFFVEFDTPQTEITITPNATGKNNRFYLYSIGFYTLN